jgi:hypothetical protein
MCQETAHLAVRVHWADASCQFGRNFSHPEQKIYKIIVVNPINTGYYDDLLAAGTGFAK